MPLLPNESECRGLTYVIFVKQGRCSSYYIISLPFPCFHAAHLAHPFPFVNDTRLFAEWRFDRTAVHGTLSLLLGEKNESLSSTDSTDSSPFFFAITYTCTYRAYQNQFESLGIKGDPRSNSELITLSLLSSFSPWFLLVLLPSTSTQFIPTYLLISQIQNLR